MNVLMRCAFALFLMMVPASAFAQGTIKGTVRSEAGPAPGVLVAVSNSDNSYQEYGESDGTGRFRIAGVPAGSYSVVFTFPGLLTHTESDVQVTDGSSTDLAITMTAPLNVMEVLTVSSASRRPERIVEAPAAVTVVTGKELAMASGSGQLPKVLEKTPGVELAQSGVFDFNINARGFNSSLNRRVLVLIDGRDPSTGFLANQEWGTLSFSLDSLESMEFVRGPGSALYGANAFNGVLNIRSRRPVDDLGGKLDVSFGTLSSQRYSFKYAGEFGSGWSYRVAAGYTESEDWSVPRQIGVDGPPFEYPGLETNGELVSLHQGIGDITKNSFYSARLDKEFVNGHVLTLETGYAESENGAAVTGLGRVRIDKSERPWFRINYNTEHWNVFYTHTNRTTPEGQTSLSSGSLLWEDSTNEVLEVQGNYDFFEDKINVVFGGSYRDQNVDTADKSGFQTLMAEERNEDQQALFGQIKYAASEHIDLVLAGRWDDSSLHDAQESPKAAIVYKFNPNHSLRATYGKAFQTPNYSEFYLRAAAGAIPYGDLQDAVSAAFGVDLREAGILNWTNGFITAVGNPDLVPEEIESYEIGYKGVVSSKLFLTVDYYESEIINFVTDLLPGVNPNLPNYQFPDGVPSVIAETIIATLGGLLPPGFLDGLTYSNVLTNPSSLPIPDGNPILALSYTNTGEVTTEGIDIAFNYYVNDHWTISGNYSWFDFDIVDSGLEGETILPNSAENKYNIGFTYEGDQFQVGANYHYVEDYPYAAGVFSGVVPEYGTVGIDFNYDISEDWQVTVVGSNVFDDQHYELFGGSVNGDRWIGTVKYKF